MTEAIALEGVTLRYGERTVLDDLSLEVKAGEVLALLGPSGCGKSSVLRLVAGLLAPMKGVVRLGGETVSNDGTVVRPPEERNVAIVFQDLALWPHLTVSGNLDFGLQAKRVSADERRQRTQAALDRVGLASRMRSYPAELSGGERQRVAIARALVLEPRAVLLDEPLSNLDVGLKKDLLATFRDLLRERGVTTLFVTHDLREAAALGDRLAVVEQGRIAQAGDLETMLSAPSTSFIRGLVDDLATGRPGPKAGVGR